MNTKAIIVYLDDNKKCLEEYSWLYKTWKMWNIDSEFDLVVYHNPEIKDTLPIHENIVYKPLAPLHKTEEFWSKYPFVNSFAMFNNEAEVEWIKQKYSYIMKTDCDVFLTRHLLGHSPTRVMIGLGDYYDDNGEVLSNLNRIAEKLKIKQNNIHNVGASIFGETTVVVPAIKSHFTVTKYVLQTEWKKDIGKWPGWYKGVASMYAFELVINAMFNNQHVALYALDEKCWARNKIDKSTLHIHAWHSFEYFSKHDWFKGKYEKFNSDVVPDNAAQYCHWIASNDLETLQSIIKQNEHSNIKLKFDDWGNEIKE